MLEQLNERSREIFRMIVDAYCRTGSPVGSRALSDRLGASLSSATIRTIMAQLEKAGLLYSPHTSSGRLPTLDGLKLFVNGLLQVGELTAADRGHLEERSHLHGKNLETVLDDMVTTLSGLSKCAGVVIAPKQETTLKHIEFVALGGGRTLVVLVTEDGHVENRLIELPLNLPVSALIEAGNYLNARLQGRTLSDVKQMVLTELQDHQSAIDILSKKVVEEGLAVWTHDGRESSLLIRGQSYLLNDVDPQEDLERLRLIFQELESRENFLRLLEASIEAEGVQIFLGARNHLFSMSGCSMVIAPYKNKREQIVGAIGVIGPTHIHYARIIPMVDYTAQLIQKALSD